MKNKKRMVVIAVLLACIMLAGCGSKFNAAEASVTDNVLEEASNKEAKAVNEDKDDALKTDVKPADDLKDKVQESGDGNSDLSDNKTKETVPEELTTEPSVITDTTIISDISVADESTNPLEYVWTTINVSLKTEPSLACPLAGQVNKGTKLQTTGNTFDGWIEVLYNDNIAYTHENVVSYTEIESNDDGIYVQATEEQRQAEGSRTINGLTFVPNGTTPGGIQIYSPEYDVGEWQDYMQAAIDESGITNDMSDYDKCVMLCSYVCSRLEYSDAPDVKIGFSVLNGTCKTDCWGYANVYDALCSMAGIYSNVETDGHHAWNYVIVDGTKYWVDCSLVDEGYDEYCMSSIRWNDGDHNYLEEK